MRNLFFSIPLLIAAATIVAGCGGQTGAAADSTTELIAFTHQNPSGKDQLVVMHTDGSGRRVLTKQDSLDPVWSPDGKRLAFLDHDQRLVVMNGDGSGRRIVSQEPGLLAEDEIASWSPDGKQLAFGAKLDMGRTTSSSSTPTALGSAASAYAARDRIGHPTASRSSSPTAKA